MSKQGQLFDRLSPGDVYVEHLRDSDAAHEIWSTILDLIPQNMLFNKLTNRRKFYSAKLGVSKNTVLFISEICQYAADCRIMGVEIYARKLPWLF